MAEKIILFLSPILENAREDSYRCPNGQTAPGSQTNEAPVKYLLQAYPAIEEILCIVTPRAQDSAWEWFEAEIRERKPGVALTPIPFDDGSEDFLSPIRSILGGMRRGDRAYLEMTGGPRNAVIYMLTLTRLLSYIGVEIRAVVYSDKSKLRIRDETYLMGFFDLISGMQELANSGRTTTLRSYYGTPARIRRPDGGTEEDKSIEHLLRAVERLKEAITLCRTASIENLLSSFNKALRGAEQCGDPMLRQMLPAFREKFGGGGGMTIPNLIRWCLESDMLQQALTIYKERIPGYILSRGVIMAEKEGAAPNLKDKKDYESREEALFQKYFLLQGAYSSLTDSLDHMDGFRKSDCLELRVSPEKLRSVALDYVYLRLMRNTVNHASESATEGMKNQEQYLIDRFNSTGKRYKCFQEVTGADLKRFILDALDNLEVPQRKGGKG